MELPDTHYRTLNGKQVAIKNKVITIENNDVTPSVCHIIFEEIFYTDDLSKYKVWCLEYALNRTTFKYDKNDGSFNSVLTLRDCIDLLWTESLGNGFLEQLDILIAEFIDKNPQLVENCGIQTLHDLFSILYAKCLQSTLLDSRLRERTTRNKNLLENIKIAVDSYMQHKSYKILFSCISICCSVEDSSFNKIVRNLYDIQLRDLNIKQNITDKIPCAKRELAKINCYSTSLGKLNCLRNTLNEILKKDTASCNSELITTDILLPIFVFLVLKTNIPNWIANLVFLKQFRFSLENEESNFLVTTLEATIEHIKSGVLLGPVEPESEVTDAKWDEKIKTDSKLEDSTKNVNYLFEQIRLGRYDIVKEIIGKSKITNSNIDAKKLCHPLCSCDKCEGLLKQNIRETTPTVFSCDDRGLTALHVACIYGQPKIVELLLENKANIQSSDYSGASALHYAATKGHQNALLLLLHSGADINAADSEKCTPLHFCCNNGHENCVKAMIYFAESQAINLKINSTNALGNTPLHNAARWGYENIVQILLEYGANPQIENIHKKTALDYAHNLNIHRIMVQAKQKPKAPNNASIVLTNAKSKTKIDERSNLDFVDSANDSVGVKPCTTKEMKRVELLLRAVAYGDVPLISYYLGIKIPENHFDESQISTLELCHPLCRCDKCKTQDTCVDETSYNALDINVCNAEGFTALHIACLHGKTEVVRILIQNGANLNISTKKGLTPLHLACQTQRNEIIGIIARNKDCNINQQDIRGNTSLHYACYANDSRISEILVKNGADISVKNSTGKSPLQEAHDKFMFSLVKILQGEIKFDV